MNHEQLSVLPIDTAALVASAEQTLGAAQTDLQTAQQNMLAAERAYIAALRRHYNATTERGNDEDPAAA